MLRAVLYFFTSPCIPIIFRVSCHVPVLLILHQVCTYDVVVGSQTMHPQLSSARLFIAQQRRAAQSSAVRCRALPFVLQCCVYVLLNIRQQLLVVVAVVSGMIEIRGSCTCFVYSSFCFLQLIVLSRSPCPPPPTNIARTAVQNVTSTSTQHSAGQLALHKHLLALLSIPFAHQIITGLFFLPHLFTCFS